ncbi:hypothetical protein [Streptococcus suis]
MASKPLLNIDKVKEPFNLVKALQYMEENGEFIRFQHNGQDFYMYQSTETRPVLVNGKRQLVELSHVRAFDRYHTPITTLDLTSLFEEVFTIMRFNEQGEPIWEEEDVSPLPEENDSESL